MLDWSCPKPFLAIMALLVTAAVAAVTSEYFFDRIDTMRFPDQSWARLAFFVLFPLVAAWMAALLTRSGPIFVGAAVLAALAVSGVLADREASRLSYDNSRETIAAATAGAMVHGTGAGLLAPLSIAVGLLAWRTRGGQHPP